MQKELGLVALSILVLGCGERPPDSLDCPDYADCDADNDGWALSDGDCDDSVASTNPGAEEVWYDGVDSDCSGTSDYDADEDGIDVADDCNDKDPASTTLFEDSDCDGVLAELDCDDSDPSALSMANDADCDGVLVEQDCDDLDELVGIPERWYADSDRDGYGDVHNFVWSCDDPGLAWVSNDEDCDDTNASINPSAADSPEDGVDTDCDGASER